MQQGLFPGEDAVFDVDCVCGLGLAAGQAEIHLLFEGSDDTEESVYHLVDVALVEAFESSVTPRAFIGGSRAEIGLTIKNSGNSKIAVAVAASDPETSLRCQADPMVVELDVGQSSLSRVTARTRRPLAGNPAIRLIEIKTTSAGAERTHAVPFTQRPLLTPGLLTTLTLVAILLLWVAIFTAGFRTVLGGEKISYSFVGACGSPGQAPGECGENFGGGYYSQVSGSVIAQVSGLPVSGSTVTLTHLVPSIAPYRTTTDEDGYFQFPSVLPGGYSVTVERSGFYPAESVLSDRIAALGLNELTPTELGGFPGSVFGTVSGGAAAPLTIVQARLIGADGDSAETRSVVTDELGDFRLADLLSPAAYSLVFSAEGYELFELEVTTSPEREVRLSPVSLTAGRGVVTGRVVDEDGNPIGASTVRLAAGDVEISVLTLTEGPDAGSFLLADVPTPGTYLLEVTADGFSSAVRTVYLDPGANFDLAEPVVISGEAGKLEGVVRLQDGLDRFRPAVGVEVSATDGSVSIQTVADNEGNYELTGLSVGETYVVVVESAGYQTHVTQLVASKTSQELNVDLQKSTGALSGVVRIQGNAADANSGIEIEARRGSAVLTAATTSHGEFAIEQLEPGTWTVVLGVNTPKPMILLVELEAGLQAKVLGTRAEPLLLDEPPPS